MRDKDGVETIYPETLPVDGKGITRKAGVHLNFGGAGGAAVYSVHLGDKPLPITYQYDSRKKAAGPTGFFIDGFDRCFKSWGELATYWPTFMKARE